MRRRTAAMVSAAILSLALGGLAAAQDLTDDALAQRLLADAKKKHTLLDLLQKGGPVMYPLYACSILTVAFGLERLISLSRRRVLPPEIVAKIRLATFPSQEPASIQGLLDEIQTHDSPLGRIVRAGFKRADRPLPELEKAMEDAGAKEVTRLQRNNRVLSSVASVSPLLGLLGTVTGIIRTFMTVAASPEALGKTEVLAAGIYEALVATAVGIAIAIPSMVLYFYFQDRVEKLVNDIDDIAVSLFESRAAQR